MDQQLSSNRDSNSAGTNQQKRRHDGQFSNNNMRQYSQQHNVNNNNNGNFNGSQQQEGRREYQNNHGRGGPGRGPPLGRGGRFDGRGFDHGGRGGRGGNNIMRGPNDMRDNNNNMNGPPQYQQQGRGRGGNGSQHHQQNQGYAQQQRFDGQQQARGFIPQQGRATDITTGRGRGRGEMPGRGRGQQNTPSLQTDIQKSQTPIPPNERRTLILSNIPTTLKYFTLQNHLQQVLNVTVQYCCIDQNTNEAYVRFKYVNDAIKVWDGGSDGLDGNNINLNDGSGKNGGGEEEQIISLVQLGVQLKAVHYTNFMIAPSNKAADRAPQLVGGRGYGSAAGGRGGGEGRGFDRKRNWRDDQQQQQYPDEGGGGYQQQGQHCQDPSRGQYDTPQSSAAAAASTQSTPNYPSNTKYHRSPSKQQQKQQLSPMEIQLQQQKQLEEQKAYEEFQIQEKEWRKRRKAEYDIFMTFRQTREDHLSTLEQKKDLLSKQESMLNQQLPLHKKMLTVLKSKNAELSEQSKKMKEILSTQTRIMELKKEIKGLVERIEKLRGEEVTKGVFRPTEKRPIFSSADTDGGLTKKKKARLDRRTTVIKVEGFNNDVTEDDVKEHFATTSGTITSASIETQDGKTFALINFANRIDAERAKSSMTKFNDQDLTCAWHNLTSVASDAAKAPSKEDQTNSNGEESTDHAVGAGEESTDHADGAADMNVEEEEGLYDDFGGDVFDIEPQDCNEEENVVYDEDEDLVDYD